MVYIASATRAATNGDSSAPRSSSLVVLHGKAGNATVTGRVWGPSAEGGRQVLHRVGDWLTSPVHQTTRNARRYKKTALGRGNNRKYSRLAC